MALLCHRAYRATVVPVSVKGDRLQLNVSEGPAGVASKGNQ